MMTSNAIGFNTIIICMYLPTHTHSNTKLECGPMPNVMVALSNIGGILCSTPQSLADTHYQNAVQ